MVRFEFTLSDVDAQNLISIINDEKLRAEVKVNEYTMLIEERNGDHPVAQANRDWYERHAEYLEGLKQKVLAGNTRVG